MQLPMKPLLSIENLTVPLPPGSDRPSAVQGISFDVHEGEILCVVGESGSGKSISASAIMGLLPDYLSSCATGRILFNGRDLMKESALSLQSLRGRELSMIFQEPLSALNPVMTVGRQIEEVMLVHGERELAVRRRRALELMEFVGLPDSAAMINSYPFQLSGGQRQRIMIAMALALEPRLLIADEPTTALDVTTQAQVLHLIADIQKQKGMGVMFITHDIGVVAEIADRVIVMEKGLIVEQGDVDQVLNRPQHAYTRKLISAVPRINVGSARPEVSGEILMDVRNLSKVYRPGSGFFSPKRKIHAVNQISFEVKAGETLGIVGESGSGKSSLGRCLLKLMPVNGGQILYKGKDITPLTERQFRGMRNKIQMVFQDPFASLNPRHSVERIICDGMLAKGVSRKDAQQRCANLLELVGLSSAAMNRYPNQFSGGQRQRIGIARALALDPEVLIADESISALDVSVQAQILELFDDIQQRLNLAIIFITHDLRVAAQICHNVLIMHRGNVVDYGRPGDVFLKSTHPYTRSLVDAIPGRKWDETRSLAGL